MARAAAGSPSVRVRIKEHTTARAGDLVANPDNWRIHPPEQREAVAALLDEVGYVDELKVVRRGKKLRIVDGHLRADIDPDAMVPIAVLDLNEDEERLVLGTFDWVRAMGETDDSALAALFESASPASDQLREMFADAVEGLAPPDPTPPGAFKDLSGGAETDYRCPKCSYEWSGRAR